VGIIQSKNSNSNKQDAAGQQGEAMGYMGGACARIAAAIALPFFLGGVSFAQAQATLVAGTMPGQFAVNESGAATYRIPIQVPPGVAGMEPKLELAYNSQGGNGLLGMGWSLSGLSAIGRCPRTMAQDGVRGSVNFDMNDRYCLDGQRLVLVSGSYGVTGSEYRTELDSFSKIVASGTAGNGVASFTVQTKAGLTMEYGNTADSRIELQGKPTARLWAVNRISDVKTNFMTFSYTEDNANGDFYPSRIDYSGNAATGQAASNSVQFGYETRPDIVRMFLGGSVIASQKRLVNAQTYIGATLAANYRVNYGPPSAATSRSLASSIDYCDGSGACFPAKKFDWSDGGRGLNNPVSATQTVAGNNIKDYYDVYPGDYNGDGITDIYYVGAVNSLFCPGPSVAEANSLSNCVQTVANNNWKDQFRIYTGDYNGDGITDLYLIGDAGTGSYFCAGPAIATSPACVQTVVGNNIKDYYGVYPADYNGDGITDMYYIGAANSLFCPGPAVAGANSLSNCVETVTNNNWKDQFRIYPGDYNGDGLTDLYLIGDAVVGSYFCPAPAITASAACIQTVLGNNIKDYYGVYPGDYNGDGITDMYYVGAANSLFCPGPAVAAGNSLANCVQIVANNNWKDSFHIYPGDYNGDGMTDLYLVGNAGSGSYFCSGTNLTTDNSSTCIQTVVNNDWKGAFNIYPGDYNGDGVTDLYLVGSANSHFASGGHGRPDLLNSVSQGTVLDTKIENTPLTNSSVYAKDGGSLYPRADLQIPMYLVSGVTSNNGIGGTTTTQYSYGGLKAELGTGRGMLGFRWMKSKNLANNIESYTEFNQGWPFTGSVAKSETRLAGSGNAGVLKRTTNTYAQGAGSAAGTTFVYPSQSVEESWDLGGTAYPTVTNAYQYGQSPQYGDPTQISVNNSAGAGKTTVNEYWPANTGSGSWILGRLKKATVTSVVP